MTTRRVLWTLVTVALAAGLVAVVGFVLSTLPVRVPYWGEAEVLFEAARLRERLPLFVDPLTGAHDLGEPPSRWYVTYPPLWAWVLSRVPLSAALVIGRVASVVAWFGSLGAVALGARRESRANAIACAAFVAGSWVLANFASVARPDSIACALAAVGLARAARKGRVDAVSLVLLVLVPWVKPTLLGLPAGAFAGDLLARRRKAVPTVLTAVLLTGAITLFFHLASGGALFEHVARSNAQPFTLEAWLDHVPPRLPFFLPLFALAGWTAFCDRAAPGTRIAGVALVFAAAWTLVALAKTGSASNYWMEPCVAAVVVVAAAPPARFSFGKSSALHAGLALAAVLYAGVASVRASIEHATIYRDDARFVATLRDVCGAGAGDVVAADEAGIELVTDGRILAPTYQMAHLVRAGRYPAETWISDLSSPHVRCVVEHTGQLRLSPAIARALDEGFSLRVAHGDFRVLVPKSRADASP